MKIISGDEFGVIKFISTKSKNIVDQYGQIDSSKAILNVFCNKEISLENEEEDNQNNFNLFISTIKENYILNWETKKIISSYQDELKEISFISSTIKFTNTKTILTNGASDDKLNVVLFDNENKFISNSKYFPVDNSNKFLKIKLRAVSNSIYNNNENIYCLYENTPLVLFNIEQNKTEFKAKNLPHDELGLKIPIYDTDVIEIKTNPRLNYVSTAYGDIRLYDKKASCKPQLNKNVTKSKINKITCTEDGNYIFIGDNKGYCAMLDIRKNFHACKTFKGNAGSIKTIYNCEKNNNLIVAGFDRYVKWYDYKSGNDDKIFVKNKVNNICLVGLEKVNENNEDEGEESGEISDSELDEESENEEEEDIEDKNEENNKNNKNEDDEENEESDDKEEEEDDDDDDDDEENEEDEEEIDSEKGKKNDDDEDYENDENDDEEEDENSKSDKIGRKIKLIKNNKSTDNFNKKKINKFKKPKYS